MRNGTRPAAPLAAAWMMAARTAVRALTLVDGSSALGPDLSPQGPLIVPPCLSPITIDGAVEEEAWADALAVELAYEIDPGENLPARVRTVCLMTADTVNLYLACRAGDPHPEEIRAHFFDRDKADDDDWILFSLDTFAAQRQAFELRINPLGVQMDSVLNELGSGGTEVDPTWDAIWASAGRVTGDGFEVEAAVPFTSLRFPARAGDQRWALQVMRHRPRRFSYFYRMTPWNRNRACTLCESVPLVGMAGAAPGLRLELTPTLTAQRTDVRPSPDAAIVTGETELDPGLTARWGVTTGVTLAGALNPDFSQVEADAAQLDVNTRFALFYPEKRTFFLEGADLYVTPLQAVYTRTVADPRWGVRVSGKEGRHGFGLVAARDEATNLLIPGKESSQLISLDQPATAFEARYRFDLGAQSAVGALVTDRRGSGYANRVLGLDASLRLSATDTIAGQALHSSSALPHGQTEQREDRLAGWAGSLTYRHEARNWSWWATLEDLAPQFRADLGFIPRVDLRKAFAGLRRTIWREGEEWYSRVNMSAEGSYVEDHEGRLTDRSLSCRVEVSGPLRSTLAMTVTGGDERFAGTLYGVGQVAVEGSMRPTQALTIAFAGSYGDGIDYGALRPARVLRLGPAVDVFLGRHVQLRVEDAFERLETETATVYEADLRQGRLVYQLDTRTFVRLIVQRLAIRAGPIATVPGESRVFGQALLSWKLNPQTVLFLGYSGNRAAEERLALTDRDRTFFAKVGYAWLPR